MKTRLMILLAMLGMAVSGYAQSESFIQTLKKDANEYFLFHSSIAYGAKNNPEKRELYYNERSNIKACRELALEFEPWLYEQLAIIEETLPVTADNYEKLRKEKSLLTANAFKICETYAMYSHGLEYYQNLYNADKEVQQWYEEMKFNEILVNFRANIDLLEYTIRFLMEKLNAFQKQ